MFFISDKKRPWSPCLLEDSQDSQSILLPQSKTKKKINQEDSTCDDCKIVIDNIGSEDKRNVHFGQLVAEEMNQIKPCIRTRTYAKILTFLNDAKGSHSSEIKYDTQIE